MSKTGISIEQYGSCKVVNVASWHFGMEAGISASNFLAEMLKIVQLRSSQNNLHPDFFKVSSWLNFKLAD